MYFKKVEVTYVEKLIIFTLLVMDGNIKKKKLYLHYQYQNHEISIVSIANKINFFCNHLRAKGNFFMRYHQNLSKIMFLIKNGAQSRPSPFL